MDIYVPIEYGDGDKDCHPHGYEDGYELFFK
jgi:hypothetical protein